MNRIKAWLEWHDVKMHVLLPIWARIPEKARWRVAYVLDKSDRYCWADLVSDVLSPRQGKDACDGRLPLADGAGRNCRTRCGVGPTHDDHSECRCYCGKFKIEATR